jgi:hypothetical protein
MLKLALGAFLALPVIGLYFSLRCRHFLTAVLTTISAGILLPEVLAQIAVRLRGWLPLGCLVAFPAICAYYVLRPRPVLALWTTALLAGLMIASIHWELSLDLHGRALFWRSLGASSEDLMYNLEGTRLAILTVVAQGGAALACGALLCHNLKRRKFALQWV